MLWIRAFFSTRVKNGFFRAIRQLGKRAENARFVHAYKPTHIDRRAVKNVCHCESPMTGRINYGAETNGKKKKPYGVGIVVFSSNLYAFFRCKSVGSPSKYCQSINGYTRSVNSKSKRPNVATA